MPGKRGSPADAGLLPSMRMRGLEPPRDLSHTDLNRHEASQCRGTTRILALVLGLVRGVRDPSVWDALWDGRSRGLLMAAPKVTLRVKDQGGGPRIYARWRDDGGQVE